MPWCFTTLNVAQISEVKIGQYESLSAVDTVGTVKSGTVSQKKLRSH